MPVYFAHISDTHLGPTRDYAVYDRPTYAYAERLVALLDALPARPDFVIHTGDIVNNPDAAAWALARGLFDRLQVPVYYVAGNHDNSQAIMQQLPIGPHTRLGDDPTRLDYTFTVGGERFLVLDATGPLEIAPHGRLTPAQLAWLADELTPDGPPLTVFIHFPLLPIDSPWMDANMLVLNGGELHALLRRAAGRLRAVFHGHLHMPLQLSRDGVTYICAASSFAQFSAWPDEQNVTLDAESPPGFSFVHLLADGRTIVHRHTFAPP